MIPNLLLGNRIIVKPTIQKETKKGNIIIPETANANLSEGVVVMVDETISNIVSIGDTAIYPSGTGCGQHIDGEPHLWLKLDTEVWAINKKNKIGKLGAV